MTPLRPRTSNWTIWRLCLEIAAAVIFVYATYKTALVIAESGHGSIEIPEYKFPKVELPQ